jgi:hypothetical protein
MGKTLLHHVAKNESGTCLATRVSGVARQNIDAAMTMTGKRHRHHARWPYRREPHVRSGSAMQMAL